MYSLEHYFEIYDQRIHREGADALKEWITTTSFETDPASTKYHGNYAGGLLDHSVNVYYELCRLVEQYEDRFKISIETVAIISLLHDVCKIGKYKMDSRNVKENGVWVQKPYYVFNDELLLGYHGPQSVFLIQKYMQLSDEEIAAIANHMGAYDRGQGDYELSKVYEKYPAAFLLHTADCMASFYDEETV